MPIMKPSVDPEYERYGTSTIPTGVPVPPPPYGVLRSVIERVTAWKRQRIGFLATSI
jgi:hypothetical protein